MPSKKRFHFLGSTIIDCGGGRFDLKPDSQLIVDSNVTLTLRNLVLEHLSGQASTIGGIVLADNSANLALQNVVVNISGTYRFDIGSMFIHEDVVFSADTTNDDWKYKNFEPSYNLTKHRFVIKKPRSCIARKIRKLCDIPMEDEVYEYPGRMRVSYRRSRSI